MSEANFTKGPWKFNAHDGSITDCTKAENEIATAQLDDWHHLGMGYSNARLIAAAPEMYAALEQCIKALPMANETEAQDSARIAAYDALAKARGE